MNMLKQAFLFLSSILFCSATTNHISSKLGQSAEAGYEDDIGNSGACFLKGTCQPLQNTTCFGISLPYTHFSVDLVKDSRSLFEVLDNLSLWQSLYSVPHCWAVIQPLLCAVYMPKCFNKSIYLPSQEMCRITRGPCKGVAHEQGWPSFLQCANETLFPSRCRNPLQEIKFNTSSKCNSSVVKIDDSGNWFHDVAGCGAQCQNPLYTENNRIKLHISQFLVYSSHVATAHAVISFITGWKKLNRYPEKIIFYVNLCWSIASFFWNLHFMEGHAEKAVQRLHPECGPSLCSIFFGLFYFFSMAAIVWFVILTYAWYSGFFERDSQGNSMQKKKAYFHMCAWCIPLFVIVMAGEITKVDGDSVNDTCFKEFSNINMHNSFVYALLCVMVLLVGLGFYFLPRYLFNEELYGEIECKHLRKKIHCMMRKKSFIALCLVMLCITFYCHAYDIIKYKEWNNSYKGYANCLAMNSGQSSLSDGESECVLNSKPNLYVLWMRLLCLLIFAKGISSLIPQKSTQEIWKSFCCCASTEKYERSMKNYKIYVI